MGSDVSFNTRQGLKVLACSLDTNINYVTVTLQLHPSLNHLVKLGQLLGERCGNFLSVDKYVTRVAPSPDARLFAEFLSKCVNSIDEISRIPSWFSFDFGLFVLLYIWLVLPAWLLAITLYMCTSVHNSLLCVYSLEQSLLRLHSNLFQAYLVAL